MLHSDLPRTKLLPPTIRRVVARPLLCVQIATHIETRRLTLISAPAGSGKTTLLALLRAELTARPCAWLALDAEDNSPARFGWGLVGALQRLSPTVGERALVALADGVTDANLRLFIGALVNDLIEALPDPFALMLDDLHEIDNPSLFTALDYLIERLPPQARLIIATRHDPPVALAKWRARAEVSEFRLPALRFSAAESQELLNDQLGLRLSPALLARIQSTTDGWAAGLQLIGLSLAEKSSDERVATIHSLARERQRMFELLAEEVLGQQDIATQQFLLHTSILSELTEALCNAVTGRTDSGSVLQSLQRRNLFLIAHGTDSYRYHDLFRDFLHTHLRHESPGTIQELHRRAAAAETQDTRAIQHWLAASAWDEAAHRIEQSGLGLYARGSDVPQVWLDALPAALIEQSAGLSFLVGMNALARSNFAVALSALERAEAMFAEAGDIAMQGEAISHLPIAINRGFSYPYDVVQRKVAEVLERAFALPLQPAARVPTLLSSFWYHLAHNDVIACNRDLNEAMQLTLASDDPMMARNALSGIHTASLVLTDNIQLATDFVRTMHARYGEGYGQIHVSALSLASSLKLLEGDLPAARELATRSIQLMAQTGNILYIDFNTNLVLAYVCHATADWAGLEALLAPHIGGTPAYDVEQTAFTYTFLYAYGCWMAGRLDSLEAAAAELGTFAHAMPIAEFRLPAQVALALTALGRGEMLQAIQQLEPLCEEWNAIASLTTFRDPRWLLAHALVHRRPEAALATIRPLLETAESKRWPGLILREGMFVKPLLELAIQQNIHAAFAQRTLALFNVALPSVVPIPGSTESLTPREMDVLRLVAGGASNQDVADRLVLSVWTVKSHLTSILGKLGAASRTQAVARARELRVI